MRVGFMTGYEPERIAFAKRVGFGSAELMAGVGTDYLPGNAGWQDKACKVRDAFAAADLRISCIAGFYINHMDPARTEEFKNHTRAVIDLSKFMGVPVVAGFAGRVIDGAAADAIGRMLERPLEDSIEPFKQIWSEHAKYAEDRGIKIAFENCPMGKHHLPPGGNNCMSTPLMWEKCFDAVPSDALGLEWDPSHLICQMADPIENIRRFAKKVHHVHAKDAKVNRWALARNGIFAPGSVDHCHVGLGDTDWAQVIKELVRVNYPSDLNIEGWHDDVFRDPRVKRGEDPNGPKREDWGLVLSLKHLNQFVDGV
jgi:sugar phosphate isomerase/epimerase